MLKSVCFVLMPFGVKPDAAGRPIDFNRVYNDIFRPAIEASGLLPVRADEEQAHGFIHKLMYERLLLSEYAIADLTILNANVYYELGVRHMARPGTTIMTMAGQAALPFDVAGLRTLPYALDASGCPAAAEADMAALAARLKACIEGNLVDSPLYQLVEGLKPPPIDIRRTDVFRERSASHEDVKAQLAAARDSGQTQRVQAIEQTLGDISRLEATVVIDLLRSYRATGAYEKIVEIVKKMDQTLAGTVLAREHLAFAQNRLGLFREAEETLKDIIRDAGPSSETNGLLGRVYKDQWQNALQDGNAFAARTHLKNAINAYLAGFEADMRDPYPGVNAVTLMEAANDPRRHAILPVVRYAAQRRAASHDKRADYWDHATLLELAALADDADAAADSLGDALAASHEKWMLETTARNLRAIVQSREERQTEAQAARMALDEIARQIAARWA